MAQKAITRNRTRYIGGSKTTAQRRAKTPLPPIDGYEDVAVVGRGGFGVVYRAFDPNFERKVAIKVINSVVMDDESESRFARECKAMGIVSGHPNIVTVFGSGLDRTGHPYLVMEYLGGGSLGDRVAHAGPLGWEKAVEAGVQLSGALETAHQAGILHRDVKPENVLLSDYGDCKLADFGICKVHGGHQTRSGAITATPFHAAPEVLAGVASTIASDVYSLGSTIFTVLAGRPPFAVDGEDTPFALFHRVSTEAVPDLRGSGVPSEVCEILESALAKDPMSRPASAMALGVALQRAQQALGVPATEMQLPDGAGIATGSLSWVAPLTPSATPGPISERAPVSPQVRGTELAARSRRRPLLIAAAGVVALVIGMLALLLSSRAPASMSGNVKPTGSVNTTSTAPPTTVPPTTVPPTTTPPTTAPVVSAPAPSTPANASARPAARTIVAAPAAPTPAPAPIGQGSAAPTVSTDKPASTGGGSTTPTPNHEDTTPTDNNNFPNASEQALLSHVSSAIRSSCFRASYPAPGSTAAVTCSSSTGEWVSYNQFPSASSMDSYYHSRHAGTGIAGGSCRTDQAAEQGYTDTNGNAGRMLCYRSTYYGYAQSWLEWTNASYNIYSHAHRNDFNDGTLYNWWLNRGGPY